MRTDEEKLSLSLHRYKNWVEAITARDREIVGLQSQMTACVEQLVYAYLEAREEQERLIAMGLDREQIEKFGVIPVVPMDPLAMAKRV